MVMMMLKMRIIIIVRVNFEKNFNNLVVEVLIDNNNDKDDNSIMCY